MLSLQCIDKMSIKTLDFIHRQKGVADLRYEKLTQRRGQRWLPNVLPLSWRLDLRLKENFIPK